MLGNSTQPETLQCNQGSDVGESLPGSQGPDKVYNEPSLPLSASCLFIYPLKADGSCFHDQAEWILSLVPLPCQRVYGLLCQRVTSSSCWQLLCCRSEAQMHRTNRKNAQTDMNIVSFYLVSLLDFGPLKMLQASKDREQD